MNELRPGSNAWINGIPYRLVRHIIGATWEVDELFGRRRVFVSVVDARACRLHGVAHQPGSVRAAGGSYA